MRMLVFSLLPGGHTRIKSSAVFTWKLAELRLREARDWFSANFHAHQVVRSFHVEVGREPITRLAQPELAPVLIQTQHQINLFVRYFAHFSSFGFDFWNSFFVPFFAPNFITTSVLN